MNKYLKLTAIILLALPMIIFGLNKFLGFTNVAPPEGKDAQLFLGAMFGSYLFKLVGFTEIVGGVLLLIRKTSFIGLLLLTPVVVNIVVFHLAHDNPGNGIWLFSLVTYVLAIIAHKEKIHQLLD
jgi:putative oxidoreductase